MVGLEDGAQLGLGGLLSFQQPVPITRQRPELCQRRGGDRQRPPVRVLMAQAVGQHERVKPVVLDGRDPVALSGPRRDPRRHREHRVPCPLQVLNEESLSPLHRDR
jgi:hypothetical protein